MNQPSLTSIKSIQRRLILILVRAFFVVAVVGMIALIGFTIFQISRNTSRNPFYRDPNATILEAYYLGRGSWEGVDEAVDPGRNPYSRLLRLDWEKAILLDENNRVVMYYGKKTTSMPMHNMMPVNTDEIPLMVNGQLIGTLITEKRQLSQPIRITLGTMNPIFMAAILLTLLTVVIGILLMRRVVNPLAEVIAAAESVTHGNLSTRIKISNSRDDLNDLAVHFNKMTETLERNDVERRAMLADIAHELRTPLSVLRGRLEGILDGVYPANESSIAQTLEETYLLERLIDDLRLLTLVETRQLPFEIQETDLSELLKKVVTMFGPQAQAKGMTITLELSEKGGIARVDPQRMEQVISNLIGNSLRYLTDNGKILIRTRIFNDNAIISVEDNGPGVKEEDLPFIFDRFWRSDKSRARTTGGAGLGLAISKQLVEAQGGRITAANLPGGGLEIRIELPAVKEKTG